MELEAELGGEKEKKREGERKGDKEEPLSHSATIYPSLLTPLSFFLPFILPLLSLSHKVSLQLQEV